MKASGQLVADEVYTRKQLKEMFDISNQSISESIFQLAGYDSVLVFVRGWTDGAGAVDQVVQLLPEDYDEIYSLDGQF